ncbi:hypothetical protein BVY02_00345, partial [bacterium J17]
MLLSLLFHFLLFLTLPHLASGKTHSKPIELTLIEVPKKDKKRIAPPSETPPEPPKRETKNIAEKDSAAEVE